MIRDAENRADHRQIHGYHCNNRLRCNTTTPSLASQPVFWQGKPCQQPCQSASQSPPRPGLSLLAPQPCPSARQPTEDAEDIGHNWALAAPDNQNGPVPSVLPKLPRLLLMLPRTSLATLAALTIPDDQSTPRLHSLVVVSFRFVPPASHVTTFDSLMTSSPVFQSSKSVPLVGGFFLQGRLKESRHVGASPSWASLAARCG